MPLPPARSLVHRLRSIAAGRPRRAARRMLGLAGLLALLVVLPMRPATAEGAVAGPAPAAVQELLRILDDPQVRSWLEGQRDAPPAPQPRSEATPPDMLEEQMTDALADARGRLVGIARAVPAVPGELARVAASLGGEMQEYGLGWILLLLVGFVALGFGTEAIFWRLSAPVRERIVGSTLANPAERIRAVGMRLGFGLLWVGSFALGSVGAFLLLSWPPTLHTIVLTYLVAFLLIRLTMVAARFFLAPGASRFRIVPMSDAAAAHWARWLVLLVGWFVVGRGTLGLLATLQVAAPVRHLLLGLLALVWLVLGLVAIWRRPARHESGPPPARWLSWTISAYLMLLWLCTLVGATKLFWLGLVAALVPLLIRLVDESVRMLLRPSEGGGEMAAVPSVTAVCLERGLRALVLVGAILFVAGVLGLDLASLAAGETMATRLLAGALKAGIILLAVDFLWHLFRAWIDRRIAEAQVTSEPGSEEARRHARLRTLLPILRNVAMIVTLTMAALMALSALGFEIGPLIAGAGVVGVAVGFGAQTIVRDIIAGMFYLMDDAFRVGEYIQSGSYKGTVESFSLRSVKLRHHRGPLYTVPFGSLGAIQNMSRDWVIDKVTVSVTYDTDLDNAKKIIKQIGKELLEIEEFRPNILETLKMQGVDQFGDFAIQLRMKMKTKPGEQFTIRRRAYAMIKKAFDANGIKFAFPTVTVAGGNPSDVGAAVARQGLELVQPKPGAA